MNARESELTATHVILAVVGAAVQLVAGFLVAFSSLVAPPWGVAVLWVVWMATTVWGVRNWRRSTFAPPDRRGRNGGFLGGLPQLRRPRAGLDGVTARGLSNRKGTISWS